MVFKTELLRHSLRIGFITILAVDRVVLKCQNFLRGASCAFPILRDNFKIVIHLSIIINTNDIPLPRIL